MRVRVTKEEAARLVRDHLIGMGFELVGDVEEEYYHNPYDHDSDPYFDGYSATIVEKDKDDE